MNYVGNYLKPGPDTKDFYRTKAFVLYEDAAARIYLMDNFMEGFLKGTADNGLLFYESGGILRRLTKPIPYAPVKTEAVRTSYGEVLLGVGAVLPVRDGVDTRIVAGVQDGTGRIPLSLSDVGGWPELGRTSAPSDTDLDGIPDKWETKYDLDPGNALDAGGDNDGDGCTNIEEYLNKTDPILRETAIKAERETANNRSFALQQNLPNPFNTDTVIDFSLADQAEVTFTVYGFAGQHVTTLVSEMHSTGAYPIHWNGRNDTGNFVSSGTYIKKLQAGDLSLSRKLLLLR